jgi:hypothetical protein
MSAAREDARAAVTAPGTKDQNKTDDRIVTDAAAFARLQSRCADFGFSLTHIEASRYGPERVVAIGGDPLRALDVDLQAVVEAYAEMAATEASWLRAFDKAMELGAKHLAFFDAGSRGDYALAADLMPDEVFVAFTTAQRRRENFQAAEERFTAALGGRK